VAQAASIDDHLLNRLLEDSPVRVQIVKDQASEVMAASDLLVVASGTATLQAAVIGTPMILVYKTTLPTYWVARLLIRVKWIGLVNLVAGRTIVPELIQDEANAERLCGTRWENRARRDGPRAWCLKNVELRPLHQTRSLSQALSPEARRGVCLFGTRRGIFRGLRLAGQTSAG
jgi:lipid A disaccharide synthetase